MNDSLSTSTPLPSAKTTAHPRRLLQAIYALILVLLVYAWTPPVSRWISSMIWPAIQPEQRDSYEFLALCFDENSFPVNSDPALRLRDQIQSIERGGYTPVHLADVQRLILENRPLAARAVLLTFDFKDLDLYRRIEPVLRKSGWYGTAFLSTGEWERSRNDQREIQRMFRSRYWEVAARSHQGAMREPERASSKLLPVLASYRWSEKDARLESPEEFRARIHADHQSSLAAFEKYLGIRPEIYAYPYGDYGQLDDGTEEIRQANEMEVSRHYGLAFTRGDLALNNRGTDPRKLNRLVVQPEWNGRMLERRLSQDATRNSEMATVGARQKPGAWTPETGHVSNENGTTLIRTDNLGREATAWYAMPSLEGEFSTSLEFTAKQCSIAVYFKRTENPAGYTRLRFDGNDVLLEQKTALQPVKLIERGRAELIEKRINTLELFLRGDRVYVRLNGSSVFGHGVELSSVDDPTRIGIGVIPASGVEGAVSIQHLAVSKAQKRLASWDSKVLSEDAIMNWLHENAGRLSHIAPPITLPNPVDAASKDVPSFQSLKTLARVYKMNFVPRVAVLDARDLDRLDGLMLADSMVSRELDGFYVDLSNLRDLKAPQVELWLEGCRRQMENVQGELLLRLPTPLESLAPLRAMVEQSSRLFLVSAGAEWSAGNEDHRVQLEQVGEADLARVSEVKESLVLHAQPKAMSIDEVQDRMRQLQIRSEKALQQGEHEKAIISLSEWHELSPSDSRPTTMIADALYALGYKDDSLDFYRKSLDANPGQVKLVARLTEIFSYLHRDEEARNLLNLYVRLFPEDPDILYAQAQWLVDQGRPQEAQERLDMILERRPLDFAALLLKLRISDREKDRRQALSRLEQLVEDDSRHLELVEAIQQYDLLTLPNSYVIVDLLQKIAAVNPNPKLVDRIQMVLPNNRRVVEDFSTGQLSGNWEVEGGRVVAMGDQIRLQSLPSQSETQLKLLRAQRLHDCYIQATFEDVHDSVWIYGRRSVDNLVRFGVDVETREVHLQIWKDKNSRIHAGHRETLEELPPTFEMRLEIRGNGVVGILNGRAIVSVPLELSTDISHGWMAVSVQSSDKGQASAAIKKLDAGPLPVHLALLPQTPSEENADQEMQELRALLGTVTDASPNWFKVTADGKWESQVDPTDDFFRLFSRYYRIRLVPTVQIESTEHVDLDEIARIVELHGVDGLVLRFAATPGSEWLQTAREKFQDQSIFVFVMNESLVGGQAHVRGLGRASLLFNGQDADVEIPLKNAADYRAAESSGSLKHKAVVVDVTR